MNVKDGEYTNVNFYFLYLYKMEKCADSKESDACKNSDSLKNMTGAEACKKIKEQSSDFSKFCDTFGGVIKTVTNPIAAIATAIKGESKSVQDMFNLISITMNSDSYLQQVGICKNSITQAQTNIINVGDEKCINSLKIALSGDQLLE